MGYTIPAFQEITMIFILSLFVGFCIAWILSGKHAGERGMFGFLGFKLKNKTFHFHHWLLGLLLIIALYLLGVTHLFIYGFLTGIILQGLTYPDFLRFIYKK